MVEEGRKVFIPNGACISITVRFKTAQSSGFNLSVPNTACYIPNDELYRPASESPPFEMKWLKGQRSQGKVTRVAARLNNYVGLPFSLTRQFRLYRVTASTFKTIGSDRKRFRQSSSNIRPKLLRSKGRTLALPVR